MSKANQIGDKALGALVDVNRLMVIEKMIKHFSVIVTVCRGPGAQGIYSTHEMIKQKPILPFIVHVYLKLEFQYDTYNKAVF